MTEHKLKEHESRREANVVIKGSVVVSGIHGENMTKTVFCAKKDQKSTFNNNSTILQH